MKRVKTPGANLENKRGALFLLGITFASALVLTAFEWRTFSETKLSTIEVAEFIPIDEVVLNAFPKEKKTPPPPKKQVVDVYDKIEDDRLQDESLDLPDIDFYPEDIVEIDPLAEDVDEPDFYWAPEIMPEFPGGFEGLYSHLQVHLRYPAQAKAAGITGKVVVEFIINKQGYVEDAKVLRGIGGGCDEEALRVISNLPRWKPGEQRGRPVNVRYVIPVNFSLKR